MNEYERQYSELKARHDRLIRLVKAMNYRSAWMDGFDAGVRWAFSDDDSAPDLPSMEVE